MSSFALGTVFDLAMRYRRHHTNMGGHVRISESRRRMLIRVEVDSPQRTPQGQGYLRSAWARARAALRDRRVSRL